MDNGKTASAVQELISNAALATGSKVGVLTAGAIQSAGELLKVTQSNTYRNTVVSNAINTAEVKAINTARTLLTRAAIEDAQLRAQGGSGQSVIIPASPVEDDSDDVNEAYLGNIINRDKIYGSVILGAVEPSQKPITWVDQYGLTNELPKVAIASAIIQVQQGKNVIITNIQGRDGSVKEYIGLNDADITIDCEVNFGINQGGREIIEKQLRLLYECPFAIPITNYLLNALGVTHVVLTDMPYAQRAGSYSNLYFTIHALQDIPIQTLLP